MELIDKQKKKLGGIQKKVMKNRIIRGKVLLIFENL